MRKTAVRLLTFIGGLFFLLEFLLPERAPAWLGGFRNPLTPCMDWVTDFLIVVGTMAFLLGPLNLTRAHVKTLWQRHKGWVESAVFLVFLVVGMLVEALRDASWGALAAKAHKLLFDGLLTAFFSSSMALLAFYLVSAAYRAFRVSNLDSGLMMASAVITLLGQIPVGDWITYGLPDALQLRNWAQWIIMVPNAAVQRAVLIGACGGAFASGLRHWLGIGAQER